MKYGSLCSGIEAATQAWHPLGWTPEFFSEIDAFPCAALAHHYPDVPNLGDMTKFKEWSDANINVLVGGTPCQSFSVAGLRKGLDDPRGNLMLTFGAIAAKYRPQWLVWENVFGVLSSNGGRDFGAFLGMLGQLGYGFAYRVLDAQYVRVESHSRAVPQRRRRVFVVGYLGDWRPPAAVLFERESLSGHPPPSRKAGKAAPTTPSRRTGGGGMGTDFDCDGGLIQVCPTLRAGGNKTGGDRPPGTDVDTCDSLIVAHSLRGEGFDASEDGTGRGTPIVPVARTIAFPTEMSATQRATAENLSPALSVTHTMAVAIHENQRGEISLNDTCGAIKCAGGKPGQGYPAVAVSLRGREGGATAELGDNVQNCLRASNGGGDKPHGLAQMRVRRLTPKECERLQGFPDDFTKIPYRNRPADKCPDGPRYKALGNSMAVNVMSWVGQRIEKVNKVLTEVAS